MVVLMEVAGLGLLGLCLVDLGLLGLGLLGSVVELTRS